MIQFSVIKQFSFIWPIDRTLADASTSSQSGPRSNGNEDWLVGWFGFWGISTFVSYLTPNPFLYK